jgi:hypothetical protein
MLTALLAVLARHGSWFGRVGRVAATSRSRCSDTCW